MKTFLGLLRSLARFSSGAASVFFGLAIGSIQNALTQRRHCTFHSLHETEAFAASLPHSVDLESVNQNCPLSRDGGEDFSGTFL
jgi:hypothetical protein